MLSFHVFAVKSRTAQQAKMKWVVNIVFYILQVTVHLKKNKKIHAKSAFPQIIQPINKCALCIRLDWWSPWFGSITLTRWRWSPISGSPLWSASWPFQLELQVFIQFLTTPRPHKSYLFVFIPPFPWPLAVFIAGGVGITCWLVVCNKVVTLGLHAVS